MTTGYKSIYTGAQVDAAVARVQGLDTELATKVDKTTTINGEPLSGNVTLNAAEVGAMPDTTKYARTITCSNGIIELLDQDGNSFSPAATATITGVTVPWGSITGNISDNTALQTALNTLQTNIDGKQATLVSGSNIKTINSTSLLGSGNINVDSLPSQTGQSGKFLTTNGTDASWATIQGGGTWGSITGTLSDQTDLQNALDEKQDELTAGDNITIEEQGGEWTPAVQDSTLADVGGANGWNSLAYGDGKLVAFSYSGSDGYYLATSTDGTTWNVFAKSGLINYTGLVYDGSKFVALDFNGYVSTSTDGTTWTPSVQVSNLGSHDWNALAYDGTKFVALGSNGYVSTSTDGTTWTLAVQDSNLGSHDWNALAYDGTKFITLGSSGYVSTSTDGTTWTPAVQVSNLGNQGWHALAYDGSKFAALADEGYVSTSTDGTTWTPAIQDSNLGSHHNWNALAYDGTKLIALSSEGYLSQYSLGGGLVISSRPTWGSITGTLSDQTDLQTVLNGKQATLVSGTNIKTINNNSLLGSGNIVVDSLPSQTGQSGKFLTTDGTSASWTNIQAGGTWGSITGTLSDQVDLQDALDAKQDKLTAGDNITIAEQGGEWTLAVQDSNLGENNWEAVAYDGTKFVALGNNGHISTSTDGTTWTSAVRDSVLQSNDWAAITYGDNKFVAISYGGSGGYYYSTSTDGTTWNIPVEVPSLSVYESWTALAYDGSKFVALCDGGMVSTSTDGTTWSSPINISTALGSHTYSTLAYGNNKFVTISDDGYISTSVDGNTWTPAVQDSNIYLDGGYSWTALAYDGTKFVAIGSGGYYSTSTDGTTWTPAIQDSNLGENSWVALTYGGNKLVALDFVGYISQYLIGDSLVISAAGGTWGSITGTLSDQTDLQDALNSKVSSTTIKNMISLTQAEYDALATKDANTVYIIIPST